MPDLYFKIICMGLYFILPLHNSNRRTTDQDEIAHNIVRFKDSRNDQVRFLTVIHEKRNGLNGFAHTLKGQSARAV